MDRILLLYLKPDWKHYTVFTEKCTHIQIGLTGNITHGKVLGTGVMSNNKSLTVAPTNWGGPGACKQRPRTEF